MRGVSPVLESLFDKDFAGRPIPLKPWDHAAAAIHTGDNAEI